MKMRFVVLLAFAACLMLGVVAPAHAGLFLDGRNILAVPKPLGNWNIHLTNDQDPSLQGNLQIVWTTCDKGVGLALTAPQAIGAIDHGVLSVHVDGEGTYAIPIEQYQLGFCWALCEWPDPWAFGPQYFDEAQTMPMFIEWKSGLGYTGLEPTEVFDSLHRDGGHVTVEYFDAADGLILAGEVR